MITNGRHGADRTRGLFVPNVVLGTEVLEVVMEAALALRAITAAPTVTTTVTAAVVITAADS